VVPDSTWQELKKRDHASRIQAIRHCRELARILQAFNHAGIPAMALKGPILSAEIYGDVGLRQSIDLDLAIKPYDTERVQACLKDLGYCLDAVLSSLTARQWEKVMLMKDDLSFFHSEKGIEVEIHSRINRDSPEQNAASWARSNSSIWQGCSHNALNPIDQILYLCSHGGDHAWFRAKWLGDLARVHADTRADWGAAVEYALSTGHEKPLLACLRLLHIVYGLQLPSLNTDLWRNVPPMLIEGPLRALQVSEEPRAHRALDLLRDLEYSIRYPRLVTPRKTWGEIVAELLYCRKDYAMLRLPNSLFWAYAPLRPVLFAWRKLTRLWRT
jgi:hypothetical protein